MVLNGLTVGAAVTPTVIETVFSHYIHRKLLHEKPTAHISYHVGLQLVRKFIVFSSHHTVEELQSFTSQWVPNPHWIRTEDIIIPEIFINNAAKCVQTQLGPTGIDAVGGRHWWQWRQDGNPLEAEWIEMRKHYNAGIQTGEKCSRCMLYVHGGAYYFGSVDEHRYQMQRHARKLQARILAPRYRLAPQFPFPCGLLDCLATYLFLLDEQPWNTIVLAGDSAGAGMIVSMLVILRDQGLPLPAGAILLSPWVDLTHSFPSVAGWNELDYVPPHGFQHKPSNAWPPPSSDDLKALEQLGEKGVDLKKMKTKDIEKEVARESGDSISEQNNEAPQGFSIHSNINKHNGNDHNNISSTSTSGHYTDHARNLSIIIDEKTIEIKDQVQIYTTNLLLSHPLVSPILQPSLGGLPPLLVLVGGGEMLRDEQIFLAHKAANPTAYPPSVSHLADQGSHAAEQVTRWPPTNVQLQVWEDLCHVAPTLSFTRPAKYMYRSVAQFGAWVLARAQKREIEILDDDDISVISSRSSSFASSSSSSPSSSSSRSRPVVNHQHMPHAESLPPPNHISNPLALTSAALSTKNAAPTSLGKVGAPLTPFVDHMIRQLVDRHGKIYPLPPPSKLPACTMKPEDIGTIKPGPVRKWLEAQKQWAKRYAKEKRSLQAQRMREMQSGPNAPGTAWFGPGGHLEGENPPPTAMVGRVARGGVIGKGEGLRGKKRVIGGRAMKMWSGWGSMHDEAAVEKEEEMDRRDVEENADGDFQRASVAPEDVEQRTGVDVAGNANPDLGGSLSVPQDSNKVRRTSRLRKKSVVDEGQIPQTATPEGTPLHTG